MIDLVLVSAHAPKMEKVVHDTVRVSAYPPIDISTEWFVNGVRYRPAHYGNTSITREFPNRIDTIHSTEVWVRRVGSISDE